MNERKLQNKRQAIMWQVFDFAEGRGLEIGPLHNPVVPPGYADVSYLDVFDRAHLMETYGANPIVAVENIPEIDFVLSDGDRVLSIPEAVGDAPRFDWVMASHVVEHVPDLVGWLEQIADITADGGALVLAVPDRRYTFDVHRPTTTLGQVLQAHELRETAPSIRAVFDHRRSFTTARAPELWADTAVGYDRRTHTLDTVRTWMARARTGEYLDSHVWVFTPGSFLEQIIDLRDLELSRWRVETLNPTVRNANEFHVVLRRLPRDGTWGPQLLADEPRPGPMPDWLADSVADRGELEDIRANMARTTKELERARTKIATMTKREKSRLGYRLRARARTMPGFDVLRRARHSARSLRRRRAV